MESGLSSWTRVFPLELSDALKRISVTNLINGGGGCRMNIILLDYLHGELGEAR